jgi:outer membrane protein assembly factor BamA
MSARRALFVALALAAAPAFAQTERIAEIRVHGNHSTPDADILKIAALATGTPFTDATLAAAERRLRDSGRFDDVEVLKRYRSIANPDEILVMLVVDERPGVSESDPTPGPFKRFRSLGMWAPILSHADGYGFTYGAQTAFVDVLGKQTRVSVPLTWGGERKAALEIERTFDNGPVDRLRGTFSATRRVNPHFLEGDRRFEAKIRGERAITNWVRAGAGARLTDNAFGLLADRTTGFGADVVFDTRLDPSFPRNAVYASLGVERLRFDVHPQPGAVRWTTDLRGYVGLFRSTVLALRASASLSDTPLPLFEQHLLGGASSVRGYPTGHRAGDNAASISAELRYPLTAPLFSPARFGLKAFVDAGTTWSAGQRMPRRLERGVGTGVYFGAGPLVVDLDVAWPEHTNKPRVHFGMGLAF